MSKSIVKIFDLATKPREDYQERINIPQWYFWSRTLYTLLCHFIDITPFIYFVGQCLGKVHREMPLWSIESAFECSPIPSKYYLGHRIFI
jgi:hypothetical protein